MSVAVGLHVYRNYMALGLFYRLCRMHTRQDLTGGERSSWEIRRAVEGFFSWAQW